MWIISNDRYKIGASISPRKLSVIFVTCNLVADCISIVDYDRINCNPKQLIAMNFSKKPLRDLIRASHIFDRTATRLSSGTL